MLLSDVCLPTFSLPVIEEPSVHFVDVDFPDDSTSREREVTSFAFTNVYNNTSLVVDNFIYNKHRFSTYNNSQMWRCKRQHSRCTAKIKTNQRNQVVTPSSFFNHNHPQESEGDILKCKIKSTVREQAIDKIDRDPLRLILQILQQHPGQRPTFKDLENLKKTVLRERQKIRPALPKTLEDCLKPNVPQM